MIYFDTRKGKPLRCVWTHLRGQLLLCKNVVLKQNCLRNTQFNRRFFCLEICKSGKPNPIKGSPKKGDSPHGVGNVAKRQKRLPCKGSWLRTKWVDWGIKRSSTIYSNYINFHEIPPACLTATHLPLQGRQIPPACLNEAHLHFKGGTSARKVNGEK